MNRLIEKELLSWKTSARRKPLIVRGARQVGKTFSIKQFGQKNFKNMVYVDLERSFEIRRSFEKDLDAKKICADIEILADQRIIPGETLLFFDEIQAAPRAINGLRYFFEDMPGLHVIAAGSLLEFALSDISFPVGRVQFLHQYPLTFGEYLAATGHCEAAATVSGQPGPLSSLVHEMLCDELRRYFFIGGMPEAVKAYAQTGSMQEAFRVQEEIAETFRLDFAKYSPRVDSQCLNAVLASAARSTGQQTKYAHLADGYTNANIKKAFETLCMAGVLRKVPGTDPSGLPLGARASGNIFKTIMVDIGLMRQLSGMPSDVEYGAPNLLHIYRGAMAEQFVGQEMVVAQKGNLYYWARQEKSSTAEVDYCAVVNGSILPVEVKSGPSGKLKSMHLFLKTYPGSPRGLVFSANQYAELPDQKLTFMPLYFAFSAMSDIPASVPNLLRDTPV